MKEYLELLKTILDKGEERTDRTGTGTLSIFGHQVRYNLEKGFPLVTTKKIHLKSLIHELLWFISGSTNNNVLKEKGVNIWTPWEGPEGELPCIYGKQWRRWEKIEIVPKIEKVPPQIILDSKKVAGIGTNGCLRSSGDLEKKLYAVWCDILHRCYDSTRQYYKYYGGKGVFVSERWHDFKNFIEDIQKLEGWYLKLTYWKEYSLDKDFFGSNCYGPDTCRWASIKEQNLNTHRLQLIELTSPKGSKYVTADLVQFCEDYALDYSSVCKIIRGEKKLHKGWNATVRVLPSDSIVRVRIIDQLKNIIAGIIHDPYSRRHVLNAWNVGELHQMALPPCHMVSQFYVSRDKKLSCLLLQRSGDAFIGIPFNIASYALLTHMIAQVCGLGVGELVHNLGDLHLYSNHVEQAKLQLTREPRPLPKLVLNQNIKSLFDFKYEDITLEGYDPYPPIKAKVAV